MTASITATICDQCGRQIGTGHERQDTDCVIEHLDHHERFVGLVCKRHYHWIDRTLGEILELFALLDDVVVPGPSSEDRHGSSIHAPAPGRLDVMALSDSRLSGLMYVDDDDTVPSVPDALGGWVLMVLEERAINPPAWAPPRRPPNGPACVGGCGHMTCTYIRSYRNPGLELVAGDFVYRAGRWQIRDDITTLIRLLRRERHWIAQQPWVDEFVTDLALLHRKVAHGAGDSMWPKSIGPCPNCKRPLFNTVGVDRVDCRRCKSSWEGIALARLRLILEQEAS